MYQSTIDLFNYCAMKLNRKQKETTSKLIDWWDDQGLLNEGQSSALKESIELKTINWKKVAEYLMGLAILSIVIAFLTLVADEWILEIFERLFEISDLAIFVLLMVLSAFFYIAAWRMHSRPKRFKLSLETLLLLGGLSFGGALNYLGKMLGLEGFAETLLVLVFAIHCFPIAKFFNSLLMAGIGWLGIMLWLGIESGRPNEWSGSWLGMNLALRYLFFSFIPLGTGLILKQSGKLIHFAMLSERTGWLFLWLSLWGLALFGNHHNLNTWNDASALSLLPWGLLMALAAGALWYLGKLRHNKEWMWMGGLALIANAYTQFFLFLWEPLHPALFFAIMGVSFWLLGRRAEMIKR